MPSGTEKIHSKMAGVDATTSVIILDVNGLTLPLKGQRLLGQIGGGEKKDTTKKEKGAEPKTNLELRVKGWRHMQHASVSTGEREWLLPYHQNRVSETLERQKRRFGSEKRVRHQEHVTITKVCTPNNKAPKHRKEKTIEKKSNKFSYSWGFQCAALNH